MQEGSRLHHADGLIYQSRYSQAAYASCLDAACAWRFSSCTRMMLLLSDRRGCLLHRDAVVKIYTDHV